VSERHPAAEQLRGAVEALVTGSGPIRARLQSAERHIREVASADMRSPAERHLDLRIGAGLVEAGDDDADIEDAIARLDESQATAIAKDILRLYELVLGVREDDGYGEPGQAGTG
jgi:hypothetical protein